TTRSDPLSVRTVDRPPDFPRVTLVGRLKRGSCPAVPLAYAAIRRGSHEPFPVRAEVRAEDLGSGRVAQRSTDWPAGRHVPQLGCAAFEGCSQPRAVRTEGQPADRGGAKGGQGSLFLA